MITLDDSGMPEFHIEPGQDFDGKSRFMPPPAGSDPMVVFYPRAVQQGLASLEQGRPVFKSVLFVRIQHPGERDTIDRQAVPDDARRWQKQYLYYTQTRGADGIKGTPLDVLFPTAQDTVEILRFNRVYTVEQLAALTDTAKGNIGMGAHEWQQKAERYLAATKEGAGFAMLEDRVERLARAVEKGKTDREILQAENEALRKQVSQLQTQVNSGMASMAPVHMQPQQVRHVEQNFLSADADPAAVLGHAPVQTSNAQPADNFAVDLEAPNFETSAAEDAPRGRHVLKKRGA